jgi:Tol biopolymer transport system component
MKKSIPFKPLFKCLFSALLLALVTPLFSQSDIYLYNDKTGTTTQITSLSLFSDFNPAISPNGKNLIFDRFEIEDSSNTGIYSGSLSSGSFSPVPGAEGGNDATWNPGGDTIAFDKVPFGDYNIYVLPISGGTPTLIAADGFDPDWAPNGIYIVYVDATTGMLSTVNTSSGAIVSLGIEGKTPDWSNNSQYIAYAFDDHIYKVRISSSGAAIGTPTQLTSDSGRADNHPTWSKNNKEVIYASFDAGFSNSDIYKVSANGGTGSKLTGTLASADYDPDEGKKGMTAYSGTGGGIAPIAFLNSGIIPFDVTVTPTIILDKTLIEFDLEEDSSVSINVWNTSGRLVHNLVNATLSKGYQSVEWSPGVELPGDMYFISIASTSGNNTITVIKR